MTVVADIAMLLWPLAVMVLFSKLPSERAVVVSFIVGWLFLPFQSYTVPIGPDITKMSLTCYVICLAALVYDFERLVAFRPGWCDLPIVALCAAPAISSFRNDLGIYDAFAGAFSMTVSWGLPYVLGRLYLTDYQSLRFAGLALLVGTLVYLPLCWFEIRMSPQLHSLIYGFHHRWGGMRLGGWRPSVFLDSGIQLGMWMTGGSLIGAWLWYKGAWDRSLGYSAGFLLTLILFTTVLCRSTGALLLLAVGLVSLACTQVLRTRLALMAVLVIAPLYIGLRLMGDANWQPAVEIAALLDEDRAQSLEFRFVNEDLLLSKAMQRPFFGWGGWGRSRVYDEDGNDVTVTDGLWIIRLGQHGLFGLIAQFTVLLSPLFYLLWKCRSRHLLSREASPHLAFALLATLFAIDCLLNDMPNPVFVLFAGGVLTATSTIYQDQVTSRRSVPAPSGENSFRRLNPGNIATENSSPS